MTEWEWFHRDWPSSMLEVISTQAKATTSRETNVRTERQFRLFGCSACRAVDGLMRQAESRELIDTAEQFASGNASLKVLRRAVERVAQLPHHSGAQIHAIDAVLCLGRRNARSSVETLMHKVLAASLCDPNRPARLDSYVSGLFRCLFRNPFRPDTFDADWRTSTAVAIAKGMYDTRDFSAMPILADALQDAGCDNEDVLNHCRVADGVHVRGCWVVDLVLGKA
jgi:hypothetical protein